MTDTTDAPGETGGDGPLRRDRDYRLLFGAVAVSQVGTQVGMVALPLLAVLVLDASPFEMGLLTAVEGLGFLLIGLPAGVWVDRLRHRPVMIAADLVRAVLLGSIPVAALAGVLSLPQLYVVGLGLSLATVFFDVTYQSHVPAIAGKERLAKANGQLTAVAEGARMAGPGVGGWVVQLLSAPVAILVDAVSYVVSGVLLARIKKPEPRHATTEREGLVREIGAGLRFVLGDPILRTILVTTGLANIFGSMNNAVVILFLARTVGFPSGQIGMLIAVSGLAGVAGSLLAGPVLRRLGTARGMWISLLVTGPFALLIPLTQPGWGAAFYVVGEIGFITGVMIYNIAQLTYRQSVTPPHLLGRMNATIRFVVWGVLPLGALLGGTLGELYGVRTTLWIAVAGEALCVVPLLLSPVRKLRDLDPGTERA